MLVIALIIAFTFPIAFLIALKRFDLYQTNKPYLNLLTLAGGVAAYFFAAQINPLFVKTGLASWSQVARFIAPVLEEILKSVILIYLIRQADFNYIVDGALYGFGAGVGFAVMENYEYVVGHPQVALMLALARVFSTNLMHAAGSGIIGTAFAYQRGDKNRKRGAEIIVGGYVVAVVFHALFNAMVGAGAALFVAIGYGVIGLTVIWLIIRRGMKIQKQWVAETLSKADRVTLEETKAVSNIELINEALTPIERRFGKNSAALVRKLIYKQAEIGIKQKLLESASVETRKEDLSAAIRDLRQEMDALRSQIGPYCMMAVREVYIGQEARIWELLNARIAAAGTTQKGGGLWDRVVEKTKKKEIQDPLVLQKLRQAEIFRELSDDALNAVADSVALRRFAPNEALMRKGEDADSFFVVLNGRVKITTADSHGQELIINQVGSGEAIGELSIIDERPRSASVIALEDIEAAELTKESFFALLTQRLDVARGVLKGFSSRLRFSTTYIEKLMDWSQKISAGDFSFLEKAESANENDDEKAARMLSAFYKMGQDVQAREEELKRQVQELTFQIDQERRKREFEEITGTEFYAKLKEQARELRQKRRQDS
ncbi:MAG: PrsW family intramembrane metalloprotease [Anaerolineales bacterium]|nr:PrsW family intramembrane metalloprotease [Anaerolineales bacterium]